MAGEIPNAATNQTARDSSAASTAEPDVNRARNISSRHIVLLAGLVSGDQQAQASLVAKLPREYLGRTFDELLDLLPSHLDSRNVSDRAIQIRTLFAAIERQNAVSQDQLLDSIEERGTALLTIQVTDSKRFFNPSIAPRDPTRPLLARKIEHRPNPEDELTKEEMDLIDVNFQLNMSRTDFEYTNEQDIAGRLYGLDFTNLSEPEREEAIGRYAKGLESVVSKLKTFQRGLYRVKSVDGILRRIEMFPVFEGVHIDDLIRGMKRVPGYRAYFHFREPQAT